ncbi:alpha/beta-hydrolase [Basidiobolus meristosporus CBS 931.73]|uniref:Alpha/beta-hydrolase n=1 Tax=Basidiobolus meristosporus CBS 931.73 TaxID=1314790 RepID=A0A1Y1YKB0_9FUNG|nr:alpha/beta-hydrolase [Basidiobolus meristosporus CBS 931.73]|eukprot:ORX98457.1 alpha/beta-hydrolase [Basidiobolus meristosporus CBS 931.73]
MTYQSIIRQESSFKYWAPVAYTRLLIYTGVMVTRTMIRGIFGRLPKGQTLHEGITIAFLRLVMGGRILSVMQARKMLLLTNKMVEARTGTLSQSSKDMWANKVSGKGWEGYWIPFKDQIHHQVPEKSQDHVTDIGVGCDVVFLAIHGGGMVMGNALMFLQCYKSWMKVIQKKHGLKVGFLSVEYTLSPEAPYPTALNECVAAYQHLVDTLGIDPKRILMCGDSAGGNLCVAAALKIRDTLPTTPLPAGQILFSPWMMCSLPVTDSPDDYITSSGGGLFVKCYIQNSAEASTSIYTSPLRASTLDGLPPQLIFIGGVETLRPSIERYVAKAKSEGVDVRTVLKEEKPHDYALIAEVGGHEGVREANEAIATFVLEARERYVGARE